MTTSGVLEIRRGKGTFVSANTVIDSADLSDIASGLDDLFEMRLMFEPDCAFLAAQRATQEEIDAICYYGEQARTARQRSKSSMRALPMPHTMRL